MGRFETELLATDENVEALVDMNGVWIDKVHDRHPPKMIILDMDSSVSPTHGEQEGTAYNGHFGCTCYHPLFLFNQFGDLERCSLRPGNVHSADGWRNVLEPVVMRYKERKLCGCSHFVAMPPSPHRRYTNISKPRDYSTSSASKRTRFSSGTLPICLRDLSVARPTMFAVSTPASAIRPDRGTRSAVSWPKWSGTPASWFLASVSSSLICRALPSGWWRSIITVARRSSTPDQGRQERHQLDPSVMSQVPQQCRSAPASRPGLQSGQLHEDTGFAEEVEHWSMTTLRDKLVKIGAKVVRHGRYVTFQLAEVAVPRDLFRKILSLIDDLRRRPAPA